MFAVCLLISGCASQRIASTLKPSGGDTGLELGQARFCIVGYTDVHDKEVAPAMEKYRLNARQLQERAKVLYPRLFNDDLTALPIMVRDVIRTDTSGMDRAAILGAGLTLGTIPFVGTAVTSHEVAMDVRNALGDNLVDSKVNFDTEFAMWTTVLTPLGSLPVPGEADLPRDTVLLGIPLSGSPYGMGDKYVNYGADLTIEAIVKSLRSIPVASLEAACRSRQLHPQELSIDGQKCWSSLAPIVSPESGKAMSFAATLFHEKPERDSKPYAQLVVAQRNESGTWVSVNGYLRGTSRLTAVSTLIEGGAPARVIARVIEEPPLQDFIDTPDLSGPDRMDNLRWSNNILLEAKNRTLEKLLKLESRDALLDLATRIEKAVLELNEVSERAKDRAQAMVEKGEGDPLPERDLSILCRQRIEVLKPVLAAIKQGAAARTPGR
jgi:hypothetical protein